MKTLNTLQTISKIAKLLSTIIFIFCVIGFVGCIVGIISLAYIPEGLKLGGTTIKGLVEPSPKTNLGNYYTIMAAGAVLCAGEAVLCKLAQRYFKHELEAGTPFTYEGAKELIRLGIFTICIPIATAIITGIVYGIMTSVFGVTPNLNLNNFVSIGLGVMLIIAGLLCRHGAEVSDKDAENTEQTQ
ncbi:MAG: hypothetical protein IJ903_00955 [Ruminococcus sp.]|nr:hypothetical protein [Ruminococcus sp.]